MKKKLRAGGEKSPQPQSRSKKGPQTQLVEAAGTEDEAAFASGELSPPINASEDLYRADKIAEAATITLGPPSSTGSDASVPDFLRRTERDAGTFAVIKVERDKGTIHFRLRADIDPGWMIQQHEARQAAIEVAAEVQRELAKVAEFKRKSRPNQLHRVSRKHKIVATAAKSVGEQQVQDSKEPLKQPKSEVKLIRAAPKSARGRPSVKILKKAVTGKAAQKVGKAREKAAPKLQLRSAAAGAGRKMLVDESLKKKALDKKVVLKQQQSKPSGFKSSAAKKMIIKNTKSASLKSNSPRAPRKTPAKNLPTQKSRVDSAKSPSSKPKSQLQRQQEKNKETKSLVQKAKDAVGKLKSKLTPAPTSKSKLQNRPRLIKANEKKVKNGDDQKTESATETALVLLHEIEDVLQPDAQTIIGAEQSTATAIVEENNLKETSEEILIVDLEADMVKFQEVEENSGLHSENLDLKLSEGNEGGEKHEPAGFEERHSFPRDELFRRKSSLASLIIAEEKRRSSMGEGASFQRSEVTYSTDEFRFYDDNSPIDDDENYPDELSGGLTDDEIEMIKEKMEEKKRKLKQVKLAEYNNAYQESRSDWENFEVDDEDIDISDELMEIFEMRRKVSRSKSLPEREWTENRGEPEEVPKKSSLMKKNKHSTQMEKIEEEEEDPSKLKMCDTCGWMVCKFENCKPVETQVCIFYLL